MTGFSLLFAFATLSSVFFIGWSLILLAKTRPYIEPKTFRRFFIVWLGITTWVVLSCAAAFNAALYNVAAQTPLSLFFRLSLFLLLPLLISIKSMMVWRDILHELKIHFKQ